MNQVYIASTWERDPLGARMLAGTAGFIFFMLSIGSFISIWGA